MNIGYYPGCSAKGSSLDYELSSAAVCRVLGLVSSEITDWNCCGSTFCNWKHGINNSLSSN